MFIDTYFFYSLGFFLSNLLKYILGRGSKSNHNINERKMQWPVFESLLNLGTCIIFEEQKEKSVSDENVYLGNGNEKSQLFLSALKSLESQWLRSQPILSMRKIFSKPASPHFCQLLCMLVKVVLSLCLLSNTKSIEGQVD